ncbi:DUF4258 domain-containing protein, partial [Vreelandella alkaliphila]
ERHQSSGGSLSVPLIGVGQPTASLNASRTKLNSDFQSVNEQSGLRAGDGGFQVNVGGTTTLTGGAITSTQTAIDEDRNRFTTAGQSASEAIESGALTLTDLANNATYEAESTSVGLSSGGKGAGESSTGLSGIGTGRDDGSASSTTESAISGLAGNQDARTGDADTGIAPIFDADNVRKDVQVQAMITQEFGSRASKLVGDTAQAKLEEAQLKRLQAQQAQAAGDTERANQLNAEADQLQSDWGDNGTKRLAAHTAIGALTGGTQGATGAAVGTLSAPAIASALKDAGLDDTLTDGLTALASTAAGAATGGTQGGAAAFNEVVNNYLRHDQVDAYIDELEGCVARGDCDEVQEKFRALSIAQQDELIALCATDAEACAANYQSLVEDGEQFRDALDGFSGRDIPWQLGLDAGPLLSQYMEAEAIVSQEGFAQYLQEQHGLDVEQASVLSAVAAGALPLGSKRLQLNQPKNPSYQPVRNESTNIGGREYSGHALDRMQDRGILPSVVENTIRNGQSYPSRGGTTVFHSSENNISVVVNRQGDVVTTRYGR